MSKDNKQITPSNEPLEFLLYKSDNGDVKVDVLLINENIWMPQKKMAELFDVEPHTITYHIGEIYKTAELSEDSTHRKIRVVQNEGNRKVSREVEFYNLDVIIAVGYRVNSARATQFRIWSNKILKEFIIKGYTMDVERLKNPNPEFGKDYFDEQLEKIRDIRSSERRFYQKITDIYSQCSIDYDPKSETTKTFFATVQNKLHWAITGQTAAEIVTSRASHKKEHMGLTTWKNAPSGTIRKTDVPIAKNYLNEKELNTLNRIVGMYLDFAEDQAERKIAMTMEDWIGRLDAFLKFNERDILDNAGKVTAEIAKAFAEGEFEKFRVIQDREYVSDFDKVVKQIESSNKKKS